MTISRKSDFDDTNCFLNEFGVVECNHLHGPDEAQHMPLESNIWAILFPNTPFQKTEIIDESAFDQDGDGILNIMAGILSGFMDVVGEEQVRGLLKQPVTINKLEHLANTYPAQSMSKRFNQLTQQQATDAKQQLKDELERNQQAAQTKTGAENIIKSNPKLLKLEPSSNKFPAAEDYIPPRIPFEDNASKLSTSGYIEEDLDAIQQHLASAAQPMELYEVEYSMPTRQQVPNPTQLKGHVEASQIDDYRSLLPASSLKDRVAGQIDIREKLLQGKALTDREKKQYFHTLDLLRYSAKTTQDVMEAEAANFTAEELMAENDLQHAPRTQNGNIVIQGVELEPSEAEVAALLDLDHFWATEIHLKPEELKQQLKDFAIGLWNFAYGDDINTLLDTESPPLAKVLAAIQFFPPAKLLKVGKVFKVVKKVDDIWAPGPFKNSVMHAYNHAMKHKKEFGIKTPKEYVEKTWDFIKNPPEGTKKYYITATKQTVLYNQKTQTAVFIHPNGVPQSMRKIALQDFKAKKDKW